MDRRARSWLTVGEGNEETRPAPRAPSETEGQAQAIHEPTRIGQLLGGKYRISRLLAQGGMGVVYEAQHEIVRRRFAVKFLRPDFAHRREFLGRFQREAEAAGALENEHIASAVDFGVAADGSPFIVMEYLVGENLASVLDREGRLPVGRAADLCVQACQGAEAAHAAGILHRDLKPKNLFVGRREDGTDLLKILDFGIAKLAPVHYDRSTTDTGMVIGTPAYMSPEQARGERALDPRSDVYALGTILFEMLSGQLPHPGDSPNAILHHISTRPPVSLAVAAPGLPRALVEIVDSALAPDPGARPQSANALALGLAPFVERRVWPDRSSLKPAASHAGEEAEPARDPSLVARDVFANARRRHAWRRVTLLAAALALVVAGAAAISFRSRKADPIGKPPPNLKAETSEAVDRLPPSVPAPSLGAAPVASPAADATPRPEAKPAPRKRSQANGRPGGRTGERPAQSPAGTSTPGAPAGASPQPAKSSMLRGVRREIDPENPYRSP